MAGRMRDLLWDEMAGIYAAICAHPFVTGLADGSLDRRRFGYYIVQDAHYLRGYTRALALCAARAPDQAELAMFAEHATGAVAAERQLHAGLLTELGLGAEDAASAPVGPATQAYVSYLLATAHGGAYAEAVAAVLPCYWLYARVGEHLQQLGSVDPLYQRWIDTYAGPDYQSVVAAVLAVTDRIGAAASAQEHALMRRHVHAAARYEWMFFDAAYRMQRWPV